MSKNIDYSMYLVTDRDILKGRDLNKAVEESILGGTTVVQLREKHINDEEFLKIAIELKKVTDKYKIPFIINDNVNVAKLVDADGVHIGQSDDNLAHAREVLGPNKIIGVSVGTIEEAIKAEKGGADYLGIGTIFFTATKDDINVPLELDGLSEIVRSIEIPNVAIGGIHLDNVEDVMRTGTDGVAIISEILGREDIRKASENLLTKIKKGAREMEKNLLGTVVEKVREKQPIVFHITNTVTINDCANITLAMGASPLMSFCEEELEDILSFSSSLVINIGTMDKPMRDMVVKAGQIANRLGKPVILDPVGVGASAMRKNLVEDLIKNVKFAVIKGNMAEIKSIAGMKNDSNRGVDSVEELENADEIAKDLALRLNTVIALTGKQDIVTDGEKVAKINNGTPILGKVTGTGCMSASLVGSTCGATDNYFVGATTAIAIMGISGEIAESGLIKGQGNASLRVGIIDSVYNMNEEIFNSREKIELL